MKNNELKKILNFVEEAGMLKRVKRSGWSVLGIKDAETVAEHSFRCAVLGYVLASMENVHPYKVVMMTLLNDIHEARLGDLHKMSQHYIDLIKAEDKVYLEQISDLPNRIKNELGNMHVEYRKQHSKESMIARDADILECLIQAKEYHEHGYKEALKFLKKAPGFIRTKSAKQLWGLAKKSRLNTWWEALSDFKR